MAESIEATGQGDVRDELRASARRAGIAVGSAARRQAGRRPGRRRLRQALLSTLSDRGYEPLETVSEEIRLGNCPFHALAEDHRELVCGMNLALAEGMLDGLRDEEFEASLDPRPGQCCVAIRTTDRVDPGAAGRG